MGQDLCALGDIDGDGVPDFLVGRPLLQEPGWGQGAARVLSGADGSIVHEVNDPNGSWFFGRNVGHHSSSASGASRTGMRTEPESKDAGASD